MFQLFLVFRCLGIGFGWGFALSWCRSPSLYKVYIGALQKREGKGESDREKERERGRERERERALAATLKSERFAETQCNF